MRTAFVCRPSSLYAPSAPVSVDEHKQTVIGCNDDGVFMSSFGASARMVRTYCAPDTVPSPSPIECSVAQSLSRSFISQ